MMRSLNPDEQESSRPVADPAELWMVEAMRARILTRARELSHAIHNRVLATLHKHAEAEHGQPQRKNLRWSP
jgi:hypothetical protein